MHRALYRVSRTLSVKECQRWNLLKRPSGKCWQSANLLPELPTSHLRLHTSPMSLHEDDADLSCFPETITVTFVKKDGVEVTVKAKEGERALYLAHRHGIEMEGACEASLACTTCHCYIEGKNADGDDFLDILPEAGETEEDLLDMAPFLQVNSRLGCQIVIKEELNGIRLRLPRATKNFYVDGHKPTPH